jgi:hypothetical protein
MLLPCELPNSEPDMVTFPPATPELGDKEVTVGYRITVKGVDAPEYPLTCIATTPAPTGAEGGTVTVTEDSLALAALTVTKPPT